MQLNMVSQPPLEVLLPRKEVPVNLKGKYPSMRSPDLDHTSVHRHVGAPQSMRREVLKVEAWLVREILEPVLNY